jgi:hypothetical protein
MKYLFLLLLFTFISTSCLQAQLDIGKRWFWNASIGTHSESSDVWVFRSSDSRNTNLLGQFSIGTEQAIADRWSFVQTYRLQLVYARSTVNRDNGALGTEERVVNARFDAKWNAVAVQAEIPVYWRYRLGKRVSITGGAYGSLSLFDYIMVDIRWDAVDPDDDFELIDTASDDSWLSSAQVGLESGLLFQLNERIDLRFNIQQAVFNIVEPQPRRELGYIQTAAMRPNLSIGMNMKFNKP